MKERMGETGGGHFASHRLTIQPSLFSFIEDEIGELDENQRLFVRLAESVELGRISAKYGWCGNGRRPSSRLAMFKLLLVKHVWNFPTTKAALAEVRRAPSMRRLCGWESQSDIPSVSTMSRAFGDFAADCNAPALQKARSPGTNLSLLPTLPFPAFHPVRFPLPFGEEVRLDCQPMARKLRPCAFPGLVIHVSAPYRTRFVILAGRTRTHLLQDLAPPRFCNCLSLQRGNHRMAGKDGTNVWTDDAGSMNGRVDEKTGFTRADVGKVIDELMCRMPKSRSGLSR